VYRKAIRTLKRAVEVGSIDSLFLDEGASSVPESPMMPNILSETPLASPEEEPLRVSQNVIDKLARMRLLHGALNSEESFPADLAAEYQALQAETAHTFLPLVERLAKAGLLTLHVDVDNIKELQKYSAIFGEATFAFGNRSIWIYGKHVGGSMPEDT
jgi:hypothetical protein